MFASMHTARHILPIIIFAQFAGTSLWFAGNAILPELISLKGFRTEDLGTITSSVQVGFILGTLIFAVLTVADKYSPPKIFFWCSVLGASANAMIIILPVTLVNLVIFRFTVGVLLAGIYPIGMKLSADWFQKSLGKAIGLLVGALVLGTAFPHLLQGMGGSFNWKVVLMATSAVAALGGVLVLLFVPNGPYRKKGLGFNLSAIRVLFTDKHLRSSAFGYFGHMWELYTFWAFVPIIITYFNYVNGGVLNVSILSFVTIGMGFFGCSLGGIVALKKGSAQVAFIQLVGSFICILLVPLVGWMNQWLFISYMLIWGLFVVGDSPQFSTLAAKTAPPEWIGSALTLMNSIGFALTIPSLYLANYLLVTYEHPGVLIFMAVGPLFGLFFTKKLFFVR